MANKQDILALIRQAATAGYASNYSATKDSQFTRIMALVDGYSAHETVK